MTVSLGLIKRFTQLKNSRFVLLFALFLLKTSLFGQILLSGDFRDAQLAEAFKKLERQGNLSVSFNPELVKNERVTVLFSKKTVAEAFDILLEKSPLSAKVEQGRFVIILPKPGPPPPAPRLVCGTVVDGETGEPLPFVGVFSIKNRLATGADSVGKFSLGLRPETAESDTLLFRSLGFLPLKMPARTFLGKTCQTIILRPAEQPLLEIVVADRAIEAFNLPRKTGGGAQLRPEKGGFVPSFGEPDPFRMLQFLPGVRTLGDRSGELHIRGGASDQNLVLWENIPLLHPNHVFGQVPAVEPFVVSHVDIWKGNAGADLGGAASGIVAMRSEFAAPPRFSVRAGGNLMSGYLSVLAPLFGKKGGLMVSGRSGLLGEREVFRQLFDYSVLYDARLVRDSVAALFPKDSITSLKKASFSDVNSKFFWQINPSSRLECSIFQSMDALKFKVSAGSIYTGRDTVRTWTTGANLRFKKNWSEKWASDFQLIGSNYGGHVGLDAMAAGPRMVERQQNRVQKNILRVENRFLLNPKMTFDFGLLIEGTDDSFAYLNASGTSTVQNGHSKLAAFFVKNQFQPAEKLRIEAGARLTNYQNSKKGLIDPRFNASFSARKWLTLKANGGIFHQFAGQVFYPNALGLNNEIWLSAGPKTLVPILRSGQLAGGFLFEKNGWTADFELFSKKTSEISGFGLRLNGEPQPQPELRGTENAAGLEVLLRKKWGRYTNWMGYTWCRSAQKFGQLNSGAAFPTDHDQRYALNWSQGFRLKNWDFSAVGHWRSGLPFTPGRSVSPSGEVVYVPRNSARLGHYSRLDCGAAYTFDRQKFRATVGATVFNVFNRENPQTRRFFVENGVLLGGSVQHGLGRVPNIYVLFRF